ncbi:MAG: Uma2 family endonuclease [Planctomycetota bacterium]|nr:Uma2 family endonuclease [Planctomycetaceae bacterium]MDQ3329069.1 Uma2 family endonuclease [Planctomycetota bacterium]
MSTLTRPSSISSETPREIRRQELHSGDRLDRATFHALYQRTPETFKAELVGGVVYVASPVSLRHCDPHAVLIAWLVNYQARTVGTRVADNGTVFLTPDRDEVQPDGMLFIRPESGGQGRYEQEYLAGGPEFVIEIATSSAAIDLHDKRDAYERAGVREYVALSTKEPELFWHENRDGRLVRLATPSDGVFRSNVFPGLWLNAAAAIANDAKGLLDTLGLGLADSAHAAFVAELARRRV